MKHITNEHYKQWLEGIEIGTDVIIEQPSHRFKYYLTTVSEVTPDGIWAKGFPSVLFEDGKSMMSGFKYLLLKPTDELLDTINLITCRRRLKSTDWSQVDDDTIMDVFDLVYGD